MPTSQDDADAYRVLQADTVLRAYAVLRALEEVESEQFLLSDGRVKTLNAALRATPLDLASAHQALAALESYVVQRQWGGKDTSEVTAWFTARKLAGE